MRKNGIAGPNVDPHESTFRLRRHDSGMSGSHLQCQRRIPVRFLTLDRWQGVCCGLRLP